MNTAGDLLDDLGYIVVYAPNFPTEDQTTVEREMERVIAATARLLDESKRDHTKQLLALAGTELVQAREHFLTGDEEKARRLVQEAEAHVKEGLRPQPRGASFVAGPSGVLKTDIED